LVLGGESYEKTLSYLPQTKGKREVALNKHENVLQEVFFGGILSTMSTLSEEM